jgi:hypothetical protein
MAEGGSRFWADSARAASGAPREDLALLAERVAKIAWGGLRCVEEGEADLTTDGPDAQ